MKKDLWRRAEELFHAALERPPEARQAFLDEACGGDAELRRQVGMLISKDEQAGSRLEKPVLADGTVTPGAAGSLVGRQYGPYRILSPLGAGGMGEVYRAHDSKLGRDVAIKTLPAEFARDPDRVARFNREAKLLASLNHPNIAAIYGLEESGGTQFLVLELVEGDTLADLLKRGPIPVEESLKLALQIAEALEAAHEKGVIHRDLKPANIKVTPEGKVKVLDFGLAKAFAAEQAEVNLSNSPTLSNAATQQGVILGTAAYMSPEQARGKSVDKRSDIWAFGCVLYEMLTGSAVFPGKDITDILAAVIRSEPDWSRLPANLHWRIREMLERCLEKEARDRCSGISDARVEIQKALADPSGVLAQPATKEKPRTRLRTIAFWLAAAIVLLAGIFIGSTLLKYFQPASPAPVVTTTIKIEPGHWLAGMQAAKYMQRPSRTAMAISSDGRFIVYSAIEENPGPQAKPQLYLRRMDQSEAKPIAGTEGGINPFLSPDDGWVGFWADGKLKKIRLEGGVATTLCTASSQNNFYGASWGRNNNIVFAAGRSAGLSMVSAEGGKPETLTKPDPKQEEFSHRLPFWLHDEKAVLFTVMRHTYDSQPWVALLRLDTREWHVLLQDAADARYVSTGHLVFLRQGTLMAVRFDPARLKVEGQPVALVENVMQAFNPSAAVNTGAGQFSISDTGSLIYAVGGVNPPLNNSLVWVDQKGIEQPVTDLQAPFFSARLSPDGRRIAYATAAREWQIWVYDIGNGTKNPLTSDGRALYPVWTPDGKRLLFAWQKSIVENLFWQPFDGSLPMARLTTNQYSQRPGSWSKNGEMVAFVEIGPNLSCDIALLEVRSGRVTSFLNSQFSEQYPEFSPPDGRWVAYSSDESGRAEVYVRPFPGPGTKSPVSSEGGDQPLWARNGKQLFYRWQDQVWVVDVRTDGGFATGKPRRLFEKSGYITGFAIRNWDLSLDGQRFLMIKLDQRKPTPVTEMILVQNWFEELKRLVPKK